MGLKQICAGNCPGGTVPIAEALFGLPAAVSAALMAKVVEHQENALAGEGLPLLCGGKRKPPCEKYTGEITCDCNGDGKDENTTSLVESCGKPTGFPKSFQSRCEDWVGKKGYYTYPTEHEMALKVIDYLLLLEMNCPTLKCRREEKACDNKADKELKECKRFKGSIQCNEESTAARQKCSQARERCLENNKYRRTGPAPRPEPLPAPTQTPTPPWFRPTSSRIFGSGPLTNPSVAVLPGFWTMPCIG